MNTTDQILVIILSAFLAIFLILSIIALVWLLKLLKQLRQIADKAESIADKAQSIAKFFDKSVPTVALGKVLSNVSEVFRNHKDKTSSKEE
jgi:biopolymer transport protein ExbB/TolQ